MDGIANLVPVINRLQDVFSKVGLDSIDLPQIAVVGAQSAGKSSVLENIVGKDFLPRGTGIVTRRPLVLQLHTSDVEYAEFAHKPGVRFAVGPEVCKEIEDDTDRVCGKNKGLHNSAINLRIYSPTVFDLTLVDLPGLTKIPIGDQAADIEKQIRDMVLRYIKKDNCIILAVSGANTDLANSDALSIAKEVDPQGARTVGVLTKLDLMDEGTDAVDILMGRVVPLRFGFIGVVNRGQKAIVDGVLIDDSLKREREFFRTHPAYMNMTQRLGIPFLAKTLSVTLMRHIKSCLPGLRSDILSTTLIVREELERSGGMKLDAYQNDKPSLLVQLISQYTETFRGILKGEHCSAADPSPSAATQDVEIVGGARVSYILHDVFQATMANIDVKGDIDETEIRTCVRNVSGLKTSLFIPQEPFEMMVKRLIIRLQGPSLQCVELIENELSDIAELVVDEIKELQRFPALAGAMVDVARAAIADTSAPLCEFVTKLIRRELAYIDVENDEFASVSLVLGAFMPTSEDGRGGGRERRRPAGGGGKAGSATAKVSIGTLPARLVLDEDSEATLGDTERGQINMIERMLVSYFKITQKTVADAVPKAIMYFMVKKIERTLQQELVKALYNAHSFEKLMAESGETVEIRERAANMLTLLQEASRVMDEVKDIE